MKILQSEKVAAYSHGVMIPFFVLGTIWLLILGAGHVGIQVACQLYGISGVFLFAASFLYHAHKQEENAVTFWRKLDHTAIFFLIAVTYTPLCYLYLDGAMKWSIIGTQWGLVVAGTVFKFIFLNAPRYIGTLIYLTMGWIVLVPVVSLVENMPGQALSLLFAGGVMYTIGAIIYGFKWPDPRPGMFGFHEIFHIFVSLGALLHLGTVLVGVWYTVQT